MPFYKPIKAIKNKTEKRRLINNLVSLREKLSAEIPQKTATRTLLLATWNIREFKSGARLQESHYYIAEIISRFDLVAVQEVANDLSAIETLLFYLGRNWSYIVTDSTEGAAGGMERIAFLYDTNKVEFMKIAGEIVLPSKNLISGKEQYARTPFSVAFQAGWFKFMLTSVHIYFGKESGVEFKRRVEEIKSISDFLSKRSKKENQTYVVLGDFNINDTEDETYQALCSGGFYVPPELQLPTNATRNKHYDQIAFKVAKGSRDMQIFSKEAGRAGVFNFYDVLFREEDQPTYQKYFDEKNVTGKSEKELKTYYLSKYRTFQMSDHLPLWVELQIDFSDQYLEELKEDKAPDTNNKLKENILKSLNAIGNK